MDVTKLRTILFRFTDGGSFHFWRESLSDTFTETMESWNGTRYITDGASEYHVQLHLNIAIGGLGKHVASLEVYA